MEKQDHSSKWKNIPEDELMSYVEEIEDDIIFYPEEAPGVFSLDHQIANQSIVSFWKPVLVFSLYGCKKVTAKVRARLLDDDEL